MTTVAAASAPSFSALQRAEIAEIYPHPEQPDGLSRFSALQRAEIAEMLKSWRWGLQTSGFSALQRAEIAEIEGERCRAAFLVEFQCSSTSRNC